MSSLNDAVRNTLPASMQKMLLSSEEKPPIPRVDSGFRDVTRPGASGTRKPEIQQTSQLGGIPVLYDPVLNRGTNFSAEERKEKKLEGLLPPAVESLDTQEARVMQQLNEDCQTDLQRYELLAQLQASNETLYYNILMKHIKELAPVAYTPTVGKACQDFDRIYRQPLGMYFDSFNHRGRFDEVLSNFPSLNVQIIVVTDGGRILGLGDLGTNGMGISIGKIALYIAGGGFHPEHSLPALLDCGTDNESLLNDRFYLGNKKRRINGEEHLDIVEEFCNAVVKAFPNALIQFEDFNTTQAFGILDRMRSKCLCFNDDIQGTGATVLAGFINGMKAQKTHLKDAVIVFFGAGSSAVGVAMMIAQELADDGNYKLDKALEQIYMVDSKGLITTTRGDKLPSHKQQMARKDGTPDMKELKDIVKHAKPHAIVGLAGAGPAFTQDVVEEMCRHCDRPLIFPLSNPTSQAEITAEDAVKWSKGKCIFAAGSPFDPVEYEGKKIVPTQANNVLVFPGLGFGAVIVKAKAISDKMLRAASKGLSDYVPQKDIDAGTVYPDLADLRDISAVVATAVAKEALESGVARVEAPAELEKYIRDRMWLPDRRFDPASNKQIGSLS